MLKDRAVVAVEAKEKAIQRLEVQASLAERRGQPQRAQELRQRAAYLRSVH